MKEILAETEHIRIVAQCFGDPTIVVAFNESNFYSEGARFWGDGMFAKHAISSIGVVAKQPNWYPPGDMAQVLPVIRNYLGSRRVVTYGYSQGGYGALKYSNELGASVALAFSPQWSINPADVAKFDPRYTKFYQPALKGGQRIDALDVCDTAFCFVDPREKPDRLNVERIAGAQHVSMPFTSHGTINMVAEAKLGPDLLRYCLNSASPERGRLRQILRGGRRRSMLYLKTLRGMLLLRALRRRKGPSILFLSRVNALCPEFQPLFDKLVGYLIDPKTMGSEILEHCARSPGFAIIGAESLLAMMFISRRLRLPETEARLAAMVCAAAPLNTLDCLHVVHTFMRTNLRDIASMQLRRIVTINIDAIDYLRHILRLAVLLKDPYPADFLPRSHVAAYFPERCAQHLQTHHAQLGRRGRA